MGSSPRVFACPAEKIDVTFPTGNNIQFQESYRANEHLFRHTTSYRSPLKTTQVPGVRGFDAAKNIKGRKRHLLVDTLGLLMSVAVTAASVPERDGARRRDILEPPAA